MSQVRAAREQQVEVVVNSDASRNHTQEKYQRREKSTHNRMCIILVSFHEFPNRKTPEAAYMIQQANRNPLEEPIPTSTAEPTRNAMVAKLAESRNTETVKCECNLTTETVEGTTLSLERVDNIERGDGLALGVLSVGDGVTDDTLEEGLENATGLFIDHWKRVSTG
jgi:hypothetical protein